MKMFGPGLLGKGLGVSDERASVRNKSLVLDEGFRVEFWNDLSSYVGSCFGNKGKWTGFGFKLAEAFVLECFV